MAAQRREWLALLLISMLMIGLPGRLLAQDSTPEATPPGGLAAQLGLITVTETPTSASPEATPEVTPEATAATEADCLLQVRFQQDGIGVEAQVAKFTKAINANPQDIESLMGRANIYRSIQNYDLAIADYQQVLKINPNYTDHQFACNYAITYVLRGENSAAINQYQAALSDYQQALKIDPTVPTYLPIYDDIGMAYFGTGQIDEALKNLNQSIATLDYVGAYDDRARVYLYEQEIDLALADASSAIRLDPQDARAYYLRAYIENLEANLTLALQDATQVVRLAPNDATSYILRAQIERRMNDDKDALTDLNQAVSIDPSNPNAYLNRSYVYADEKQYDLALKDLNQTLQLAPNDSTVLTARSEIYRAQGNDTAALADANQVVQLDPTNPDSYLRRGYIYDDMKNAASALADYNKAIQLAPTYPWGYLARGSSYGKQGDIKNEAADYWQFAQLDGTHALDQAEIQSGSTIKVMMEPGLVIRIPFEGKAGQVVTIACASPGDAVDSLLVLLDANRQPIAADDDSGGDTNALISKVTLPTTGTYTIIVTHAGGNNTGNINVTLTVSAS